MINTTGLKRFDSSRKVKQMKFLHLDVITLKKKEFNAKVSKGNLYSNLFIFKLVEVKDLYQLKKEPVSKELQSAFTERKSHSTKLTTSLRPQPKGTCSLHN